MYRKVLSGLTLLVLSAAPLGATQLVPMDTRELTNGADRVVVATVRDIVPRLDGVESPGFSFVLLDVQETWKGAPVASVTVKLLGGQTSLEDPKSARIHGVPRFLPGDTSVFFLSLRPEEGNRFYNVRGWNQGRMRLVTPSMLANGRSRTALRDEVERHVRDPKPPRYPPNRSVRAAVPPMAGPPAVRELPGPKAERRVKRGKVTTRETPTPGAKPGLSDPERRKVEEMRDELRRKGGAK